MAPHVILVSVEIHPESRMAFLEAIETNALGSRKEAGCLRFDVLQDKKDENKFIFYEVYANDSTAVDAHRGSQHYKAWADFKAKHGVKSQTVSVCNGIMYTPAGRQARSKL